MPYRKVNTHNLETMCKWIINIDGLSWKFDPAFVLWQVTGPQSCYVKYFIFHTLINTIIYTMQYWMIEVTEVSQECFCLIILKG